MPYLGPLGSSVAPRYETFRTYVVQVLNAIDPDPAAQVRPVFKREKPLQGDDVGAICGGGAEPSCSGACQEAKSARAVFHAPSFASSGDLVGAKGKAKAKRSKKRSSKNLLRLSCRISPFAPIHFQGSADCMRNVTASGLPTRRPLRLTSFKARPRRYMAASQNDLVWITYGSTKRSIPRSIPAIHTRDIQRDPYPAIHTL